MIATENLYAELDANTAALQDALSALSPEQFNASANGWSPGAILEHLLILEGLALKAVQSEAVTSTRPPDEKIPLIRTVMQDRNTKRPAPPLVMPSGREKDYRQLMEAFTLERAALKDAIANSDLSMACTQFKHPGFGTLTRLEWVVFTIAHAKRHLEQVKELQLQKA
jgi:uncharacterized damage-inducible protein DinB